MGSPPALHMFATDTGLGTGGIKMTLTCQHYLGQLFLAVVFYLSKQNSFAVS